MDTHVRYRDENESYKNNENEKDRRTPKVRTH